MVYEEDLVSKKRHSEAAQVLLDYGKDVREAVIALVGGNGFSEARRLVEYHVSLKHQHQWLKGADDGSRLDRL